jgi:hypothetical protein
MPDRQWRVRPALNIPKEGLWLGAGATSGDGIRLGTLAEVMSGALPTVWLATGKEQVVAVVGKRGSGKTFTLGVIAEGFSAGAHSAVGRQIKPRGVLLFDPLDVYWTLRFPVGESDNAEARRHYSLARSVGLTGTECAVSAWMPGGNRRETDPDWFQTLQLSVPEMTLEEWELLLGNSDVFNTPLGQALADVIELVRSTGYRRNGRDVAPVTRFNLEQLVDATDADALLNNFHPETIRALRQRLSALSKTRLFSADGTEIKQLVRPGSVAVVLLGRLPQSYRVVVVAVLTRMLLRERSNTAFAEKRLALDPKITAHDRKVLQAALDNGIARTVVMLDEAQAFLAPGTNNAARNLFVQLVKEGRNIGLSAVLATQQPSALDSRILSQVETFLAHQLVTESDIRAIRENLKSELPESIQFGSRQLDISAFLRILPPGYCLISASDQNTPEHRCFVTSIRPRATVHGGIEL